MSQRLRAQASPLSHRLPTSLNMLSLFQCCEKPFFAITPDTIGERSGPGYLQSTPVILRVRCPHCNEKAEARLAASSTIAYSSPSIDSGIRLLREPHGALLDPIQLTPSRLVEIQAEEYGSLSRAWNLITALSAASNASRSREPDELSIRETANLLSAARPDLHHQYMASARHCSIANISLDDPTCNWSQVAMRARRTPAIDGRI